MLNPARAIAAALIACLCVLALAAPMSRADVPANYPDNVFTDTFESGNLSNWNGTPGTGQVSVTAQAAYAGSYGLRLANTLGQYSLVTKQLSSPLVDSSTHFRVRPSSATTGIVTVAQARDANSSGRMWELLYDATNKAFWFYPYRSSGSVEVYTGANSAPAPGGWIDVEVRYGASSLGGAQLFINGQTQPAWAVSGDYTRSSNYTYLQLWNDGSSTVDFDEVSVNRPSSAPTAPGAPTGVTGTPGNGTVALSWGAPAGDGGSPISGYRITPYIGAAAQTPISTGSAATSYTVAGLSNGTAYTFTVAATNAAGTGAASSASPSYTPRAAATVPAAPDRPAGSAGNGSVALSWNAPADNGGSAISGYRITPYIGAAAQTPVDTGSAARSYTVTGLTNGTAYTFTVAATNAVGTGPASPASVALTPVNSGYTTRVFSDGFESGGLGNWTQTLGNGAAAVAATAAHQGGGGVRLSTGAGQYVVETKNLGTSVKDSSTSFYLRTNATSGIVTVAQARDANSSAHMWDLLYDASNKAFYFYPYNSTGSTAVYTGAGSAPGVNTWMQIEVRYTALAAGGAQLYIDGQTRAAWSVTGDYTRTSAYTYLQLWNDAGNDTVDFDDVAVNAKSAGPTAPGAPTGVTTNGQDSSVTLTWTAPDSDGGSPITSYRITPYIGSTAQTPVDTGSASPSYTLRGLRNGTAYTFTVAATNAAGTGAESEPSTPETPRRAPVVPGAPTSLTGDPGNGSVALTWTAPSDDGGAGITDYRIVEYRFGFAIRTVDTGATRTSYTVTGLSNGSAYQFTVYAVNTVGNGPESAKSAAYTPHAPTAPGAPTNITGSVGSSVVQLEWVAPADNGDSAITGYRITPYVNGSARTAITSSGAATSYKVTGLANGTTYTFAVAAINGAGTGANSAQTSALTPVARGTVVSLEFDDDIATQYQVGAMLKAHGMHATFYANSGLTGDSPGAWRMTWTQLKALAADGNEIGGHTLDHADITQVDSATAQHEVCDDRQNLLAEGFNAVSFAYPYGGYQQNNPGVVVQGCGYTSGRTVGGIRSDICPTCDFAETLPPADPFVTRTPPDIRSDDTLATMQGYVTQAEQHGGGWVQLVFHQVCDGDCDVYATTPALLTSLLDWLQPRVAQGTVVRTVSQTMNGSG